MEPSLEFTSFQDFYVKKQKIGQGAFGRVYLGHLIGKETEKLAIKEYRKVDERHLQQMWTEYLILKKFSKNGCQKGILCCDELFIDTETNFVYLIMKYIDGVTLKKAKIVNPEILYSITKQLIQSLAIVHKNGIIHGDIKPDNIMVESNNEPTLIDFGLSCFARNKDCTYRGSLLYMAPELFSTGFVSKKSDIWSLAVSIYHLCQGDPYPLAENAIDLKKIIADKNTKLVLQTEYEPLNVLINSMLVFNQAKRPSANKLLKILE